MNISDTRFLEQLGYRIRELRLAREWTQAELAERCGLHRTFIGSVERRERNVSILNLRLIARILRVSLPDLFDNPPPDPQAGARQNLGQKDRFMRLVACERGDGGNDSRWVCRSPTAR